MTRGQYSPTSERAKRTPTTPEGNICTDNEIVGIGYFDNATGVARQNECSGNEWDGILVLDLRSASL